MTSLTRYSLYSTDAKLFKQMVSTWQLVLVILVQQSF